MTDPDMGTWHYSYDTLGQLLTQLDAKQQTTTMVYDQLGRMTQRTAPEDTTLWTYDTRWVGALTSVQQYQGTTNTTLISSRSYTYWPFGSVNTDTTVIGGTSYTYTYSYDAQGRLSQTTYPNSFATQQNYYSYGGGIASVTQPGTNGALYWKAYSYDQWGKPNSEAYGNGLQPFSYRDDASGRLTTLMAGSVQSWSYGYDPVGNLTSRTDQTQGGLSEAFTYDALNRVKTTTLSGGSISGSSAGVSENYDNLGNLSSKSDIGSYQYTGPRPHAVTQAGSTSYGYDANGNMTTAGTRTYTWASYNLPTRLDSGSAFSTFVYGPSRERLQQAIYSASQMSIVNQ